MFEDGHRREKCMRMYEKRKHTKKRKINPWSGKIKKKWKNRMRKIKKWKNMKRETYRKRVSEGKKKEKREDEENQGGKEE